MTRPNLLEDRAEWKAYKGQKLSVFDTIHIFKITIDEYYQKITSTAILSEREQEKAVRFFHQNDRERYIVSKYLLRVLLGQFLELRPEEIDYEITGNRKPFVQGIQFNVSHSKNQLVIAISETPVGIDIEYVAEKFDFETLLTQCFSPIEITYINTGQSPYTNFYTLWTRKEALLKASAEGLIENLGQVPSMSAEVTRNEQTFTLESYQNHDGYLWSLAYHTPINNLYIKLWDYTIFF